MDAFISSSPASSWEQICSFDDTYGLYNIRLAALGAGTVAEEILMTGESITLTIPFVVTGNSGSTCTFTATSESCYAVNNVTKVVTGQGGSASFVILQGSNISLVNGSDKIIYDSGDLSYMSGFPAGTTIENLLSEFTNSGLVVKDGNGVIISSGICKNGYTVNLYSGEVLLDSITVVIEGDVSCDGEVTAKDYLYIKRAFLGTMTLNEIQLQAAYLKESTTITAATYLKIKRHVLGTYNLYD